MSMTRRRFLASLLALCVAFLPLTSDALLFLGSSGKVMVASGTVTDANMTITLTAGSADIDFSSATVPRNYQGYELHIQDSAGREVIGFVYTNGAGTIQNIVSAKGGSTRNWTYQHASFDTTDDYKYQLFKIWNAPIVASGAVTAANSHLDTTAANAFAWLNGVDLSAFQDDRHMLWVYDSSGRGRGGFISSSAPAGETLDVELIIDPSFDDNTKWTCQPGWSVAGGKAVAVNTDSWIGQLHTRTLGYLYKGVLISDTLTGGTYYIHGANADIPPAYATTGTKTGYITGAYTASVYWGIWSSGTGISGTFTDISFKRVLDPPSTAVKILAAKAGARGWLYADAAFDPNTAVNYSILYLGD
jgi:hypothetical protein